MIIFYPSATGDSCNGAFIFINVVSSFGCGFFVIGSETAELDISEIHHEKNSPEIITPFGSDEETEAQGREAGGPTETGSPPTRPHGKMGS